MSDVKEVWKFINYISPEFPSAISSGEELSNEIANMREEMSKLRLSLKGVIEKAVK